MRRVVWYAGLSSLDDVGDNLLLNYGTCLPCLLASFILSIPVSPQARAHVRSRPTEFAPETIMDYHV